MLSSSKFVRPRSLHSPAWALSHASTPNLLALHGPYNVQTQYRHSKLKLPSRRTFSWTRRRQWGYSNRTGLYKLFECRSPASKDGKCSSPHPKNFNDRGHSIYRYLSSHGWRMSNSWGRPGYGLGNFSRPSKSGNSSEVKDDWDQSFQERQAGIEKKFEEFKKMVDADPYGMLFGWRSLYSERRSADEGKNGNSTRNETTSAMKGRQNDNRRASTASPIYERRVHEHESQPFPSHPEVKTTSRQETEAEEYEFDPITMRKVPKRPPRPASAPMQKKTEPDSGYVIPVKPFVTTGASSVGRPPQSQALPRHEALRTKQPGQNWLAQEGFGAGRQVSKTLDSDPQQQRGHLHLTHPKIETALDRHLRVEKTQEEEPSTSNLPLKSKSKENTQEDVDMLRASDVRASAGLNGRTPKETNKESQERRKTLENDYERRPQYLDARLKNEFASRQTHFVRSQFHEKRSPIFSHPDYSRPSCPKPVIQNHNGEPRLTNAGSEQQSDQLAELSRLETINRKKVAVKKAHEEELKAQKTAMESLEMRGGSAEKTDKVSPEHSRVSGKGDMASNVYESVGRGHWYKQQAPHAMKESELKFQQLAKDRALVREIRSIYEDEYGTIDTQHRQPSREAEQKDDEHTQKAIDESSKQLSKQKEQKDKEAHEPVAIDQLSGQSSFRTLPDRVPTALTYASKPDPRSKWLHNAHKFDTIGFQPRHLRSQGEQKNKEHEEETRIQSERLSPGALPDMADANSSSNNSAKPRHVEDRSPGRPVVSNATPNLINESGVEVAASTCRGAGKPDAPTTTVSLSSDDSGSSSTSKSVSPETADSTKPSSYRILAYDPSTQRVTSAKTTSLTAPIDEKTLTLVEALSRLAAPARFLPHFASLNNSGYEIVSGSTNVLIFKKVKPAKPASPAVEDSFSNAVDARYPRHTNPIDGTTTQTGNFASPTGFVNHDAVLPPSEDGQPVESYPWSAKPNDKITRQEEVFSGSRPRWEDHHAERMSRGLRNKQRRAERRKRTLKRMIWVGVWVAGCCYAVGVGLEFLRA